MGAEHLAFQQIWRIGAYGTVSAFTGCRIQYRLHLRKQLTADDGFMGILNGYQIVRASSDLPVVDAFGMSLHQIAGVGFTAQYFIDRPRLPFTIANQVFVSDLSDLLLVYADRDNTGFIQTAGDGVQSGSFRCPLKYLPHHRRGLRVDDELMAVVRCFQITIHECHLADRR